MHEAQAATSLQVSSGADGLVALATDLVVTDGDIPLVAGVSLQIRAGERIGLIGQSGSGKSLLCRALTGLLPESLSAKGTVRFAEDRLAPGHRRGWARHWGTTVGWVGQDSRAALNPLVTVGAQVQEPLRRLGWTRHAATHRTLEVLSSLGFDDPATIARRHPGHLSGGQRQRAVIAVAVAASPQLVVADEPTSALDPVAQQVVLKALATNVGEAALLLVTHDVAAAATLCDRLVVMHRGQVIADGPSGQVLTDGNNAQVMALVQATKALSTRKTFAAVKTTSASRINPQEV